MNLRAARTYARQIPRVLGTVFGNRELRRVELAFVGFNAAEWAVWIAMVVYAYERGGATTAALAAVVQLVPATLFAPFAAVLGDRLRAGRVLCWGYVAQALGMGVTAAVLLSAGPSLVAYACAAVAATAVTITRPTQAALVPSLVRRPEELTAANVVSGWIESMSIFVAPALAGLILAIASPGAVFAVMALVAVVSALLVIPVPGPAPAEQEAGAGLELTGAFRLVGREPATRTLVLLLTAHFVAFGALDVLYAELAIGELGKSSAWTGYFNAAFGLGGTLGIAATVALVGRRRLVPALLVGMGVWFTAFLILGLAPSTASALLLLAVAGVGGVVVDVAGRTLLQRVAPGELLARVFGLLESLAMAGTALGSLMTAALIALGGARLAFFGISLLLPLVALLSGRRMLGIDAHADVPVVEIGLLRALPLFAVLPPATLEQLARSLVAIDAPAATVLVRQGDHGDRFYVVADGVVGVVRDGTLVASLGRGEGFGEVALLRDVPRTATCTTTVPTRVYALEKDDFLTAVAGHPRAAEEARRLAAERVGPVLAP